MQADDEATFRTTLEQGLALHPSEPAFALLAGAYAGTKRHPDAARWISIVMEEAPGWAAPHVLTARWLLAEGRIDQALVELREAELRHPGSGHEVMCELLARFPKIEYIERAAPANDQRVVFLNRTAAFCRGLPEEVQAQVDRAILKDEPAYALAVLREARRLVAEEHGDEAIILVERALADAERARAELEETTSRGVDTTALNDARARVEVALGQTNEMRATIIRLRGQARGEATATARSFVLEAELEASLGNIDEALAAYEAADAVSPSSRTLHSAAILAEQSGRRTHARRIYRTMCMRNPGGRGCMEEARLSKQVSPTAP